MEQIILLISVSNEPNVYLQTFGDCCVASLMSHCLLRGVTCGLLCLNYFNVILTWQSIYSSGFNDYFL